MIPQTTELSQIQAAFIDKDNRIEELMRQINSAQSLLNSLKDTVNSLVGDGKITIQTYAGSNVGDFTVNQKENKTITLPQQAAVNNGTLTIQKNGTSVGTFTANQSGDTTANITVPTKTSEITNDSDFVSDANYVHTDNNFTNDFKTSLNYLLDKSYTEYSGRIDLTQTSTTLFTHNTTLVNKVIEISLSGASGNYTFSASGIYKSYASGFGWILSGYIGSSGLPIIHYIDIVMYSNGDFNIHINRNDSWTSLNNIRYNIRVYN